jgi:Protein of unknown function (DUF3667)
MNLDIEPVGDIVTGALIAGVVDSNMAETRRHVQATCLNCNASLIGQHCHHCGQSSHVHRSLSVFWHDFLHSIFHFDGKIWRTLPMLAFRPGELTRRYVHGERARFVSPLALFLFSVFLMFATFNWIGVPIGSELHMKDRQNAARAEIEKDVADANAKLAGLQVERHAALTKNEPVAELDDKLAATRVEIAGLQAGLKFVGAVGEKGVDKALEESKKEELSLAFQSDSGSKWLDDKIGYAAKNPKLLIYKMQSNAYKFSWLLIPLSVPFIWLVFAWRRQYQLYDHVIFITYSLSFMTLLLAAAATMLAVNALSPVANAALVVAPPLHMFAQLKGAYALRTRSALWRTFAMLFAAAFVMMIFAFVLLALGVTG